jgi:hypothetical protein
MAPAEDRAFAPSPVINVSEALVETDARFAI